MAASTPTERQNIGKRIQACLDRLEKSQTWLADKLGLQPNTVSQYVNGKRGIEAAELKRIAKALGVKASWLYGEEEYDPLKDEDRPRLVAFYDGMDSRDQDDLLAYAEMKWRRNNKAETTHGPKATTEAEDAEEE